MKNLKIFIEDDIEYVSLFNGVLVVKRPEHLEQATYAQALSSTFGKWDRRFPQVWFDSDVWYIGYAHSATKVCCGIDFIQMSFEDLYHKVRESISNMPTFSAEEKKGLAENMLQRLCANIVSNHCIYYNYI